MGQMTYAIDISAILVRGAYAFAYRPDEGVMLISKHHLQRLLQWPCRADDYASNMVNEFVGFLYEITGLTDLRQIPIDEPIDCSAGRIVITSHRIRETDELYAKSGRPLTIVCGIKDMVGVAPLTMRDEWCNPVQVIGRAEVWRGGFVRPNANAETMAEGQVMSDIMAGRFGVAPAGFFVETATSVDGAREMALYVTDDNTYSMQLTFDTLKPLEAMVVAAVGITVPLFAVGYHDRRKTTSLLKEISDCYLPSLTVMAGVAPEGIRGY